MKIRSKASRQYRFVVKQLVSREIKRKYARSYLGVVWSVLNPLLSMAVLSMIFSTMFKRSIENYPIYYLTGMILWNFFSQATSTAMTALEDNRNLLLRVKLSKKTFVLARVYTAVTNLGYTCIAYVLMLLFFKIQPSWYLLLLPVDFIFITLFAMGFAYILSILYVFFGDIKHLYSVLLQLWMFMCAIFYPVETVTGAMQLIITYNPIYAYINFARDCVLYRQCPDIVTWLMVVLWGLGIYILGCWIFNRQENRVMQRI